MTDTPPPNKPPAKKAAAKKKTAAPKVAAAPTTPAPVASNDQPTIMAKAAQVAADLSPTPDVLAVKARELNITLAVVTGFALLLLVISAAIFGAARLRWVVVVLAPAVVVLYLVSKRYLIRMPDRPPLIQADAPVTLLFAGGLPLVIVLCACACALWPGHDYSIPIIASAVWFGLTLESALKK
jgi:hypothetical protein